VLYTIGVDGWRNETLFTLPDGAWIKVFDVAASEKGEIAIVATSLTADTRATAFLAQISSDRKSQILTRIWPYGPHVVTFALDGALWTIGILKNDDATRDLATQVLRRFDTFGKLLSSVILNARGGSADEETLPPFIE
jgi:hypothetical protein